MRILVEEYQYNVSVVKNILHGIDALENVEGKVSLHYVGYYYCSHPDVRDCVFILPKVLLKDVDGEELVFGKYKPEHIVHPEVNKDLDSKEKDFLYKFAVWIYRAIVVYKNDTRENKLNPNVHLSIAAEVNERFAEEIAHKLDIEYVQQSCIAIDNENLKSKLEIAHDILSQYMDVGDIRRPMTNDGIHKWLFTFYSEP
jgi:hypothetical protein